MDSLAGHIDTADSLAVAVELLSCMAASARPAVLIVPRCQRPETTAERLTEHERTLRAADGLGRGLVLLEHLDDWRRP